VLRKLFELKKVEVTPEWGILHDRGHNLYSSPRILWTVKSKS